LAFLSFSFYYAEKIIYSKPMGKKKLYAVKPGSAALSSPDRSYRGTTLILLVLLIITFFFSMSFGGLDLSFNEMISSVQKWFTGQSMTLNERIFMEIRLPRAILCLLVGATLAVGGVLMQALFRNPIVEPGLVGTSSGAAFGAALYFVIGIRLGLEIGSWVLPVAACLGGILSSAIVFTLSRSKETGKSSVVSLLLTGIAVNALFLGGVGYLSYIARSPQLRDITFWCLGNLSGASWHSITIIGITTILCIAIALRYGKQLNALMIGEEEAQFLGVNIKRFKLTILLINVIMVAVATAFVGIISFVGLIVPHLLRIINGSDNRFLIRNGALLGGIILSLADLTARVALRPAELPLGVVTSLIGVPVFLILLRTKNNFL
jgi:iron complex transport system permease protein